MDLLLAVDVCSKEPVYREVTGAVVTVKMPVVKDVEVAPAARPVEAVMTEPGPEAAVQDDGDGVDRVEAQHDGDQRGGVVEAGLHRVHAGAGEGGGVVGLVVEIVDLAVENFPQVGDVSRPSHRVEQWTRGPRSLSFKDTPGGTHRPTLGAFLAFRCVFMA